MTKTEEDIFGAAFVNPLSLLSCYQRFISAFKTEKNTVKPRTTKPLHAYRKNLLTAKRIQLFSWTVTMFHFIEADACFKFFPPVKVVLAVRLSDIQ